MRPELKYALFLSYHFTDISEANDSTAHSEVVSVAEVKKEDLSIKE
jgi:hypothetical protein